VFAPNLKADDAADGEHRRSEAAALVGLTASGGFLLTA
jgi:hypothetical protein